MLDLKNDDKVHGGRKVLLKFCTFNGGIFLNFAGYLSLLCLQSSINIEGGAGNILLKVGKDDFKFQLCDIH